jgi:hypothetical protein
LRAWCPAGFVALILAALPLLGDLGRGGGGGISRPSDPREQRVLAPATHAAPAPAAPRKLPPVLAAAGAAAEAPDRVRPAERVAGAPAREDAWREPHRARGPPRVFRG